MAANPTEPKGFSLRRWSQRKLDAARDADQPARARADVAPESDTPALEQPVSRAAAPATPEAAGTSLAAKAQTATRPEHPPGGGVLPQLPSIDSLTIDADYSGFMQAGVDDSLKRGALKKLFSDPRFNVMDGLDVYIDDYSKPDPIDPALVRTLVQAKYIFDPPPTRVTAEGYVEDIPEDDLRAAEADAASAEAPASPPVAGAEEAPTLPPSAQPGEPVTVAVDLVPPRAAAQPRAVANPVVAPFPKTEPETR